MAWLDIFLTRLDAWLPCLDLSVTRQMSNLFRPAYSQVKWIFSLLRETSNGCSQAGWASLPGPACHLLPSCLIVSLWTWLTCSRVSQTWEVSVLDRESPILASEASKLETFGYLLKTTVSRKIM